MLCQYENAPDTENVSGPVRPVPGLGPVPVPVISGPDDWSRSQLNFGPGTGPGPHPGSVVWFLKCSY